MGVQWTDGDGKLYEAGAPHPPKSSSIELYSTSKLPSALLGDMSASLDVSSKGMRPANGSAAPGWGMAPAVMRDMAWSSAREARDAAAPKLAARRPAATMIVEGRSAIRAMAGNLDSRVTRAGGASAAPRPPPRG